MQDDCDDRAYRYYKNIVGLTLTIIFASTAAYLVLSRSNDQQINSTQQESIQPDSAINRGELAR